MTNHPKMEAVVLESIQDHLQQVNTYAQQSVGTVVEISKMMIDSLKSGGKIIWCGNGGSAADAQHLAAELLGRFKRERRALPSIALTTDTSVLTAIGNDYGYELVFSRQIEAMAGPQDVVVGISTSGNSLNVIRALRTAKQLGAKTVCFLGNQGGKLKAECDIALVVPSPDTARIQEMHIMTGHIVCDLIEREFA